MTDSTADNAVTKEEIANALKKEHGWSLALCQEIVDEFFTQARGEISNEGKLVLTNFGSFKKVAKAARPGRSFQDNTSITIPAREVISFSASAKLREALNPVASNEAITTQQPVQEVQPGAFHSAMTQFMSSNVQQQNSNLENVVEKSVTPSVKANATQDNSEFLSSIDNLLSKIYSDKQHISKLLQK